MKQAQLKSIVLLTFFAILSMFLIYAQLDTPDNSDVTLTSPANNAYALDDPIKFICNGSAVKDWNITNILLWTNLNGSWIANETHSIDDPSNNTAVGYEFTLNAIPDGIDLIWNCEINYTNVTGTTTGENKSFFASPNKTVNVEYRPTVTLVTPVDGNWSNTASTTIKFNVSSIYTSGISYFDCYLYTNTSASNWSPTTYVRGINASNESIHLDTPDVNETVTSFTHTFEEGVWKWGMWCAESADNNIFNFSNTNRTFNVDWTDPVIVITNPTTNTYSKTSSNTINYTITDLNPELCLLYINTTGVLNITNNISTTHDGNFTFGLTDAHYSFIVSCNDSASNWANSSPVVLYVDTDYPNIINVQDGTPTGYADRWTINFTSDESVNYTIYYGTTIGTTSSITNATKTNDTEVTLKSLTENTLYYYNITACDAAGNCNVSGHESTHGQGQYNFSFPFHVYTGWSYFGIFDSIINFSRILTDSGTEYVYFWNQTGQDWIYATSGGTSEMNFEVGVSAGYNATGSTFIATQKVGRHVVALYEEVNSTWDRNISTSGAYTYNFTSGDNFLKMYRNRTMGQIALSLMNTSNTAEDCLYGVELCQTPIKPTLTYNLTQFYFSAYNNTANSWTIDYIYNWSWNNNTPQIGNVTPYEVAWIYSPANITWNGSSITGNWSIPTAS